MTSTSISCHSGGRLGDRCFDGGAVLNVELEEANLLGSGIKKRLLQLFEPFQPPRAEQKPGSFVREGQCGRSADS